MVISSPRNVAWAAAAAGYKTLLSALDTQGYLTGVELEAEYTGESPTLYDTL